LNQLFSVLRFDGEVTYLSNTHIHRKRL